MTIKYDNNLRICYLVVLPDHSDISIVLILDGNPISVLHAWWKIGLFGEKKARCNQMP